MNSYDRAGVAIVAAMFFLMGMGTGCAMQHGIDNPPIALPLPLPTRHGLLGLCVTKRDKPDRWVTLVHPCVSGDLRPLP